MFSKKKLWTAIENGQSKEALSLIKEFSDVNAVYTGVENENGLTFLSQALNRGQIDVALSLLDNGADVNLIDSRGKTALMGAAKKGHKTICKKLTALPYEYVYIPS